MAIVIGWQGGFNVPHVSKIRGLWRRVWRWPFTHVIRTGRSWHVLSVGVGTIRKNATWIFGTLKELQPLCQQYFSVVARQSTPARIWNCTLFSRSFAGIALAAWWHCHFYCTVFWHAALSQAGHRWENFFWASPPPVFEDLKKKVRAEKEDEQTGTRSFLLTRLLVSYSSSQLTTLPRRVQQVFGLIIKLKGVEHHW